MKSDRDILLSLIGSLTLCDHMGDVADDVNEALKQIGLKIEWDEWRQLGDALGKMGVKTIWNTDLGSDDDDV